jgi:hypothetical protein
MSGTAEVIQLDAFRGKSAVQPPKNTADGEAFFRRRATRRDRQALSATGKNEELRKARREIWWMAEAAREYWRLRFKLEDAICSVQRHGLPEGDGHPAYSNEVRHQVLGRYRKAIADQLLTPAPEVAAVTWKQAALASEGECLHNSVTAAEVERAIAQDIAFLAAHPVRQSKRKAADDE